MSAFFEIWKAKHICHEALLLIIRPRDAKNHLATFISAQKKMSEIIRAFCSVTLFILHADAGEDISPGWQVRRGCGVPVCSRQELCGRSAPGSG